MTIKIIPDAQTRALEFESGKVDLPYGNGVIGLDTFAQYKKDKKYTTDVSTNVYSLVALNAKQEVFQDKNVRKAINHAINKKKLQRNCSWGQKLLPIPSSKSTPHSDAGLTPYKFDKKEAETMLDAAGWKMGSDGIREKDGKKMELNFLTFLPKQLIKT